MYLHFSLYTCRHAMGRASFGVYTSGPRCVTEMERPGRPSSCPDARTGTRSFVTAVIGGVCKRANSPNGSSAMRAAHTPSQSSTSAKCALKNADHSRRLPSRERLGRAAHRSSALPRRQADIEPNRQTIRGARTPESRPRQAEQGRALGRREGVRHSCLRTFRARAFSQPRREVVIRTVVAASGPAIKLVRPKRCALCPRGRPRPCRVTWLRSCCPR